MSIDRIGVLTSGGDSPGMNTAIRAVVRRAGAAGLEVVGIEDGYDGLINGTTRALSDRDVGDILHRGGTVLQTARCMEMFEPAGVETAVATLHGLNIDGLVVIGGDGSIAGADELHKRGIPVIGVPASIDNDIRGTNMSIGVDSALNTIAEAVDRLRDTASSHQRVFLVEVMGRNCGYLAMMAGLTCGAELVIIPEVETSVAEVNDAVVKAYERGKSHAFVVVAEGASISVSEISDYISASDHNFEARVTILGHVQRGGNPSSFDRLLATRMGVAAVEALLEGKTAVMTGLTGREIVLAPFAEVVGQQRAANLDYYNLLRVLAR